MIDVTMKQNQRPGPRRQHYFAEDRVLRPTGGNDALFMRSRNHDNGPVLQVCIRRIQKAIEVEKSDFLRRAVLVPSLTPPVRNAEHNQRRLSLKIITKDLGRGSPKLFRSS
jgi:hypothetical protein